jgi:hypothetical protein
MDVARKRAKYGGRLKRWRGENTAVPKMVRNGFQTIEKSKKADQCLKVKGRGRRKTKMKKYSSLSFDEFMRDVKQI